MPFTQINLGTTDNDGTGDSLKVAGAKINNGFSSLDYSDIANTPTIPSATSDLTNDSGFITETNYLGVYISLAALNTAHATSTAGKYADVDAGAGTDVVRYIWDADDNKFVEQGATGGTTTVEDVLTSTSTANALSANQGKALKDAQDIIDARTALDATGFSNNLETTDDDLQKIANKVDALNTKVINWLDNTNGGTFLPNAIVNYNGVLYVNLTGTNTDTDPSLDATNWSVYTSKSYNITKGMFGDDVFIPSRVGLYDRSDICTPTTPVAPNVILNEIFNGNTLPVGMTHYGETGASGTVATGELTLTAPTASADWASTLDLGLTISDLDTASYVIDYRAKTNNDNVFFGVVLSKIDPATLADPYYYSTTKGATDVISAYASSFTLEELRLIDWETANPTPTAVAYPLASQLEYRDYRMTITPTEITIIELKENTTVTRTTTIPRTGTWFVLFNNSGINSVVQDVVQLAKIKITKL